MTEEEFFINNYPDSCYGDKPLSPHWDFFQDGVEFGERKSEKRIEDLEKENEMFKKANEIIAQQRDGRDADISILENRIEELEERIEKMKCLNEEIIKALNECLDYEWLHAHNGKAKYFYLQTVIDIVNEKFEGIKEK